MSQGHPGPGGLPLEPPAGTQPVPGRPSFTPAAGPSYAPAPPYAPGLPYAPGPPPLSEQDLRRLPPPVHPEPARLPAVAPDLRREPRPGVVAVAASLAVTASLLWICALSLAWVTATVGASDLAQQGEEGSVFHILNRFHYRMLDGLAWPLYGFPAAALVTGFAVLSGRSWARVAHSVVGALVLAWSAYWLRDNLAWWVSPAAYVAIACLILWTPAANRWFARRPAP